MSNGRSRSVRTKGIRSCVRCPASKLRSKITPAIPPWTSVGFQRSLRSCHARHDQRSIVARKKSTSRMLTPTPSRRRSGALGTERKISVRPEIAMSLRDELLMLWLVILPWRQKNLRQCRIAGGSHLNLYFAPIRPLSAATRPKWLALQEKSNAEPAGLADLLTKNETKGKNQVEAFLPAELVVRLEEYLAHREVLIPVGRPDPGTLFLTNGGKAMNSADLRDLVEELTSRHTGVAVNPHLFRDIVAYEWLKLHPHDYLTLSNLLWHKNLEYTVKVYASRINESTAIARMDDWRSNGGRKTA